MDEDFELTGYIFAKLISVWGKVSAGALASDNSNSDDIADEVGVVSHEDDTENDASWDICVRSDYPNNKNSGRTWVKYERTVFTMPINHWIEVF